jgi:hypothetical protein
MRHKEASVITYFQVEVFNTLDDLSISSPFCMHGTLRKIEIIEDLQVLKRPFLKVILVSPK